MLSAPDRRRSNTETASRILTQSDDKLAGHWRRQTAADGGRRRGQWETARGAGRRGRVPRWAGADTEPRTSELFVPVTFRAVTGLTR